MSFRELTRKYPWLVLHLARARYPSTVTVPDGRQVKITPLYRDGKTLRRPAQ